MRRFAVLSLVMGMILVMAPPVSALIPAASVDPSSGLAGTSVTVSVSGFTGNIDLEVHEGGESGSLLGAGATNGSGIAGISITIPAAAAVGPFTLYVCGIPCVGNEFSERATVTFTVTPPPPPTTTTTTTTTVATTGTRPPTTDPLPPITPAGACAIPEGAIHIDFDGLSTGLADRSEVRDPLARDGFYLWQSNYSTMNPDGTRTDSGPILESGPTGQQPDISDFAAHSYTDPRTWLGTSSPPNILRSVDNAHFSVESYRTLHGEMDYFGFNLGFGHYSEGFERPEYVQYDVSVSLLPVYELDGSVFEVGWDELTVTLGPGPQAVTTCVLLENAPRRNGYIGGSTWKVDIVPHHLDGSPIHLILEMDDVFYGTNAPVSLEVPVPVFPPPETTTTTELTLPFIEQPIELPELPSGPSYLPWMIASVLVGLMVGAGVMWGFRRRT